MNETKKLLGQAEPLLSESIYRAVPLENWSRLNKIKLTTAWKKKFKNQLLFVLFINKVNCCTIFEKASISL